MSRWRRNAEGWTEGSEKRDVEILYTGTESNGRTAKIFAGRMGSK